METIWETETFTVIHCDTEGCGVAFALADSFIRARREDHATWYCPNGHPRHYPQKNETEELRQRLQREREALARERARADQARAEAEHQAARVRGYKGALAKSKKRQAKGVCPVPGCRRHFVNVERHVASQHPDFAEGRV